MSNSPTPDEQAIDGILSKFYDKAFHETEENGELPNSLAEAKTALLALQEEAVVRELEALQDYVGSSSQRMERYAIERIAALRKRGKIEP